MTYDNNDDDDGQKRDLPWTILFLSDVVDRGNFSSTSERRNICMEYNNLMLIDFFTTDYYSFLLRLLFSPQQVNKQTCR